MPSEFHLNPLDAPVVVSELAGVCDLNPPQVYQLRKRGILPQNTDSTLRSNLSAYISYLKNKAAGRDNDAATRALEQKTLLDRARTEDIWLKVRATRGTLLSMDEFLESYEPAFLLLRDSLLEIAHDFPNTSERLKSVLEEFADTGEAMKIKAEKLMESKMEELLDPEDSTPSED